MEFLWEGIHLGVLKLEGALAIGMASYYMHLLFFAIIKYIKMY
jgi:hypothetical protein